MKDYSKNRSDLSTYYNVGKLLSEAGKHYGEGIIKEYSKRLTRDLNKKYDASSLNKMKKFYYLIEKMATVSPKLSYSHYVELLPYNDLNKINYYIKIVENYNLSIRQLRERIRNKEYERLSEETKLKLINKETPTIQEIVKDPIVIRNTSNKEIVTEKILQKLIMEDISSFLEELGTGFTFIKNEYKIKIGSEYNYIDLLLFNYEYNCFVVIELKVTKLKKNHIGQIHTYINYIDQNVKKPYQDKTVGIIICKKNNKFVMEYCSDKRIISKEYELI